MHVEKVGRGAFRQWKTWRLPGSGLSLTGYSRANDKTFFHVPELHCALDAGLAEGIEVDTVLLTHAHLDHAKDLDFLASKRGGAEIFVPHASLPYVEAYLRAATELNHAAPHDPAAAAPVRLHGVQHGDEVSFGRQGRYVARVVECLHKVPCVGYGISEVRKRLRPEYAGRNIAELKQRGMTVDEVVRRPLFAYLGDTHADVYAANDWLFEHPVVVAECTYLDDAQRDRARLVGHTVWSELRPVVEAHPETLFVLIHFSLRHSDREVVEFFEREGLPNVVVWAHPAPDLPEAHQRHDRP